MVIDLANFQRYFQIIAYHEEVQKKRLENGIDRIATPEEEELSCKLADVKIQLKELEEQANKITAQIRSIADKDKAERILIKRDGKLYVAGMYYRQATRFDVKLFKEENPGVYKKYLISPGPEKNNFRIMLNFNNKN